MMKIMYRVQAAVISGRFFALNEFDFDYANVNSLRQSDKDVQKFPFDIKAIDWDEYISIYMLGIRKFVLKENPKTLPKARSKMKKYVLGLIFHDFNLRQLFQYYVCQQVLLGSPNTTGA